MNKKAANVGKRVAWERGAERKEERKESEREDEKEKKEKKEGLESCAWKGSVTDWQKILYCQRLSRCANYLPESALPHWLSKSKKE